MVDAWSKIYQYEGASGLYRGFWVSTFQIVSGVFYISTYEGVRHVLTRYDADTRVKSLVAGGCASLVGQTIVVPFDVLSQHLMFLGVVNCGKENKVHVFHSIHTFLCSYLIGDSLLGLCCAFVIYFTFKGLKCKKNFSVIIFKASVLA
jgi:hypothetical protein